MASSNRDLTIGLISKLDKFDLKDAENQFSDLGDAAKDTGKVLDQSGDDAKRAARELEKVGDQAKDTGKSFDRTRDDLDAFLDKLSMQGAGRKAQTELGRVERGLKDVGDEAQDTGREMFASFSGSMDDIGDAAQELLANAGAKFGPAGLAIGGALAAGAAVWYKSYEERAEKLRELTAAFTDELIESRGRLSEEFLNTQIEELGSEELIRLSELADKAGVSVRDLIRAKVGDVEAQQRVNETIAAADAKYDALANTMGAGKSAADDQVAGQRAVRDELGLTGEAIGQSKTAYDIFRQAVEAPVTPSVNTGPAKDDLAGFESASYETKRRVKKMMGEPISVPVTVEGPSAAQVAAVRASIVRRFGSVTIPTNVAAGAQRFIP